MRNAKIKLIIGGIILLIALIFFAQNRSPTVALVIFGSETIALPVALWLIIGTIFGFLTSLLLQLLFRVSFSPKKPRREWDEEEGDFEFPEAEEEARERFTTENRSSYQETTENNRRKQDLSFDESEADWESPPRREDWNQIDDDWNIEEPPPSNFQRKGDSDYSIYEIQSEPEKTSQTGSVYSYRYREANREFYNPEEENYDQEDDDDEEEDNPTPKSSQIYEANYRVIRPPLWNLSKEENNDDEDKD